VGSGNAIVLRFLCQDKNRKIANIYLISNIFMPSGVYKRTIETRKKISEANKGKKHSEETRREMSEMLKKQYKEGKRKPPMSGKHHSEEARRKMSKAQKERKRIKRGIWKTCIICGKKFYVPPCRIEKAEYCSKKCMYDSPIIKAKFSERMKKWRIGKPSPAKGKKWTKKSRENRKGKLNPNYKGTTPRSHHMQDRKYKEWRLAVFKRDNFTCMGCKQVGGFLQAHHLKKWSKYPKLRYVANNGVTLCKDCHSILHRIKLIKQ